MSKLESISRAKNARALRMDPGYFQADAKRRGRTARGRLYARLTPGSDPYPYGNTDSRKRFPDETEGSTSESLNPAIGAC